MKTEKQMLPSYLTELKNILTELKPYKAVLFGSYAYGKVSDDSVTAVMSAEKVFSMNTGTTHGNPV
jgi:hypothetical protein